MERQTSHQSYASVDSEISFVGGPNSSRFFSRFIRAQPSTKMLGGPPVRKRLSKIIDSAAAQAIMAVVTVISFVDVVADTDSRASGTTMPAWLPVMQHLLFTCFLVEFAVRMYVERVAGLRNFSTCADALLVLSGIVEYALAIFGIATNLAMLRVLRLVRLLKLSRVVYHYTVFTELRKMISMIGSCFKTLFWSLLLLGVVLTVWSIVAVEILHPLVKELIRKGEWSDCSRCHRAFASVFESNITFFQTIVAGDSWGKMAIPIIEAHPWTAIIFAGTLVTVVFGVMNVIVAVIVDAFAEARSKDIFTRARDLELEEKREKKVLAEIFDQVDRNGDGHLSLSELNKGARKVEMFAHWLRVLDIDSDDMEEMFQMLDRDGSGDITAREFIEWMYRLKNGDAKTATQFLKQKVTKLEQRGSAGPQATELESVQKAVREVAEKMDLHQQMITSHVTAVTNQIGNEPPTSPIGDAQLQEESPPPDLAAMASLSPPLQVDSSPSHARGPPGPGPPRPAARAPAPIGIDSSAIISTSLPTSVGVDLSPSAASLTTSYGASSKALELPQRTTSAPSSSFRVLSRTVAASARHAGGGIAPGGIPRAERGVDFLATALGGLAAVDRSVDEELGCRTESASSAMVRLSSRPAPFLLQGSSSMSPPPCQRSLAAGPVDVDLEAR